MKWVNVIALAHAALPGIQINRTRYFTAMVKPEPSDPQQAQRQQTYIRALKTLPNLTVHYGHYQKTTKNARSCHPPPDMVRIHHSEEKGTDVNIATYMLVDAFRGDCDQLIVITNDSDLAEPIRIINSELGLKVIVLNPHSAHTAARKNAITGGNRIARPSYHLKNAASLVVDISSDGNNCHMTQAQLPHVLRDNVGTITIPPSWV